MAEKKVQSLTKRDPNLSREEIFARSPFKVAYDIIGDEFLSMPRAAREFIMDMVMSGDLTATEIRESSKNLLPYDPTQGKSVDTFFDEAKRNIDIRNLYDESVRKGGFQQPVREMSDEEFYKTFFGYDYKKETIPLTETAKKLGFTEPEEVDNLPVGPEPATDPYNLFAYKRRAAEGGTVTSANVNSDPRLMFGIMPNNLLDMSNESPIKRKKYSPDEYQSSFIDFYGGFGGIDVNLAPDADDDDDGDDTRSTVLDSGYNQEDDGNMGTSHGQLLPNTRITSVNYNDYIRDFGNDDAVKTKQGQDKSLSGFGDHLLKNKDQYLVGAALDQAIPGIGAIMGISAHLYRKQTLKNANAIASVAKMKATESGGSMFKVGNRIVSRAPGERVYTGMVDQNVANAMEGISLGFIPRTWREDEVPAVDGGGYTKTGKRGLIAAANGQSIMDPFGNYHHVSGVQGAGGARDMRENLLRNALVDADISTAGVDIRGDGLKLKMALDAHMRGRIGAFTTVARMGTSEYNRALKDAQDFIKTYVQENYGSGAADDGSGTAGAGTTGTPRSVIDSARMAGINVGPATSSRAASSAIVRAQLESAAQRYRDSGRRQRT